MGNSIASMYNFASAAAVYEEGNSGLLQDFLLAGDTEWINAFFEFPQDMLITQARYSPETGVCGLGLIVFLKDENNNSLMGKGKHYKLLTEVKNYVNEETGSEITKIEESFSKGSSRFIWSGEALNKLKSVSEINLDYYKSGPHETSSIVVTLSYKFDNYPQCEKYEQNSK